MEPDGVVKEGLKKADLLYDKGMLDDAIDEYKAVLSINPNLVEAHYKLGKVFLKKEMFDEAKKEFKEVLKIDSSHINARYNLETLNIEVNLGDSQNEEISDLKIKKSHYDKKKSVGETYSNDNYGFSMRFPKGWREASDTSYSELLCQFEDSVGGSINIIAGPIYGVQETIEDLENMAKRNVKNLNGIMISLKRIEVDNLEAIEAIYTALGMETKKVGFVKDGNEFIITCSCGTTPGLFAKYEPIFDECIQSIKFKKQEEKVGLDKEDTPFYDEKKLGKAIEKLEEASRIDPNDAEAHYNLGLSFLNSNRFYEAEKEFKEAIKIKPDYVVAIHDLGVTFANLKRYEEAEREWRKALSIDPHFSLAQKNLNQVLLINIRNYIKDVIDNGPLFFIRTFWASIISFILLWWAGFIITDLHATDFLNALWYTLKFLIVFCIFLFFGFTAIAPPQRYMFHRRYRENVEMYGKPVLTVILLVIIFGACIEGIFEGSQAALSGAIGAGLVGLGGILGMLIGGAVNASRHTMIVVLKRIEWSMIFSTITAVDVSHSISGQKHLVLLPWVNPVLNYVGGNSGALGAIAAGALIIGACLTSLILLNKSIGTQ
ncbi:MAG: tetratricopeptide repeat protein [Thermotogota bacterium]|nr:tetratricopeptide repeat protein [Thermotogota bacterium]